MRNTSRSRWLLGGNQSLAVCNWRGQIKSFHLSVGFARRSQLAGVAPFSRGSTWTSEQTGGRQGEPHRARASSDGPDGSSGGWSKSFERPRLADRRAAQTKLGSVVQPASSHASMPSQKEENQDKSLQSSSRSIYLSCFRFCVRAPLCVCARLCLCLCLRLCLCGPIYPSGRCRVPIMTIMMMAGALSGAPTNTNNDN